VFVVAFHAPCAGVPMPVNNRQLCTGSRALDTAIQLNGKHTMQHHC